MAEALAEAKSKARGEFVIKSNDLSRSAREILIRIGCLQEIIRGWYLLTSPEGSGSSTAWFEGHWVFLKHYLEERFGKDGYCLNAEYSLNVHAGDTAIPNQIIILTNRSSNQTINLPHNTSVLLYHHNLIPIPSAMKKYNGVNIFKLEEALCRLIPSYFTKHSLNIEIALKQIRDVTSISRILLENDLVNSATRLAGAFKHFGENKKCDQIIGDMKATGRVLTAVNPFETYVPSLTGNILPSPYVGRIRAMWKSFRQIVIDNFPAAVSANQTLDKKIIELIYSEDAYHSLSIEGYRVTKELIKTIEAGEWHPNESESDRQQMDALAAKGYFESFKAVMKSVDHVINGKNLNLGDILKDDLQSWYRELFSPLLQAGLLSKADLAGYRNQPVYIKGSRHVPLSSRAVIDAMEVLFELLNEEEHPAVRAILGHYVFVYIHPYMDGNGRMGRFLMNLMLISGDYNWTVIRSTERDTYMNSLEKITISSDIKDFVLFVASEMKHWTRVINDEYANEVK